MSSGSSGSTDRKIGFPEEKELEKMTVEMGQGMFYIYFMNSSCPVRDVTPHTVGRSAPLRSRFKSFDKVELPDLTGGFLKEAGHENRHRRLLSLFSDYAVMLRQWRDTTNHENNLWNRPSACG